jgi:phospholipid/cholesterol/gamma-HCH transport system permease protein
MFAATGIWVESALATAGRCMCLLAATAGQVPRTWRVRRQLLRQMVFAGFGSVAVLCLITTLTGMIMVMAIAPTLKHYGTIHYLGFMLGGAFCRELGPLWAAIIILARVGSAMAAELGTMAVNEEVEALRVMDISPVRYLALPRVLGLMLVMPALTAIGDVVGLYGSALVAQLAFDYPVADFFESMRINLDSGLFLGGIGKSIAFGLAIGIIACDQGLNTVGGAEGVGQATTNTVRLSVIFVLILDLIIPMPEM